MSEMAKRAERELNSYQAKQGVGQKSTSTEEAGVNADVGRRFPGAEVKYGSEVTTGASDNKPIPEDEGGVRDDRGKLSKAKDFEGHGGPQDKAKMETERRPGDQDTLT